MSSNTATAIKPVDAREAARIALGFVAGLYNELEGSISDLGLEEIFRDDDVWTVTVGFSRPWSKEREAAGAFSSIYSRFSKERDYKRVKVDARSGAILGVEIRAL